MADGFGQHKHHSADIVDSSGGRSPDVGVVTCPSGFSRVGPAGGRNSYCISTDEETAAYSDTARNACIAKNTGSQGPAHIQLPFSSPPFVPQSFHQSRPAGTTNNKRFF